MAKMIILDNGHGGVINGVYQTKGKRSPIWNDGRVLYEGEFNRDIVKRVSKMLDNNRIPYVNLVPELEDISLQERMKRANKIDNSLFVSIHANAGGGTGFEVFSSVQASKKSKEMADITIKEFNKEFPELRNRGHKKANFYVIKNTKMPAILIECAFMDTLNPDCELMFSEDGRNRFAKAIFESICSFH